MRQKTAKRLNRVAAQIASRYSVEHHNRIRKGVFDAYMKTPSNQRGKLMERLENGR